MIYKPDYEILRLVENLIDERNLKLKEFADFVIENIDKIVFMSNTIVEAIRFIDTPGIWLETSKQFNFYFFEYGTVKVEGRLTKYFRMYEDTFWDDPVPHHKIAINIEKGAFVYHVLMKPVTLSRSEVINTLVTNVVPSYVEFSNMPKAYFALSTLIFLVTVTDAVNAEIIKEYLRKIYEDSTKNWRESLTF